jgi:hypothetical protein
MCVKVNTEHQLDATITGLLIFKISSTCFGQAYAHLHERKTEFFYNINKTVIVASSWCSIFTLPILMMHGQTQIMCVNFGSQNYYLSPHHTARTTHKTRSVDQKLMDSIDQIVKGSGPLALNMNMSSFVTNI